MEKTKKPFDKKKIFCKRNIIIGVSVLLAIVLLTTGLCIAFADCGKGKFDSNPDVEKITKTNSTTWEPPTDGTTPADYAANDNVFYAFGAMESVDSFVATSKGKTVTKVGIASVNQSIKAKRVVNGSEVYKESVSHSTFKSVAVRTFVKGDNYVVRDAKKVNSVDAVDWLNTANRVSKESFLQAWGAVPNSITLYVLKEDTILSSEFLGEENGVFTFKYTLDPIAATGKIALEMRTMAGTDSIPAFSEVNLTIKIDSSWRVMETSTDCTYRVDMLGGVTCTESLTETFTAYEEKTEIPDVEFYRAYLVADVTEPVEKVETALDYVMDGFAPYLTGGEPLKVRIQTTGTESLPLALKGSAEVAINIEDLSAIQVKANVENVTYQGMALEDIFIAYKDGQVYLSAADFKGYGSIEEMNGILNRLLPIFNVDFDISSLFADMQLETILEKATLTKDGDNATVTLPLELGETAVEAQLSFAKTEETTLFLGGVVSIDGFAVSLSSDDAVSVADIGEGYHNIAPLFDVIDENGCILLKVETAGVSAFVNFNLATLTADINLGDLVAKYAENKAYINYQGFKASLALTDIAPALEKLQPILENYVDLSALETLGEGIDVMSMLGGALNGLTLAETENELVISTEVEGAEVTLTLAIADSGYAIQSVAIVYGDIAITAEPTVYDLEVIPQEDLARYKNIVGVLKLLDEECRISLTIDAGALTLPVTLDLKTMSLYTAIDAVEVYANLNTGDVYARYPGVQATANFNDLEGIIEKLQPLLATFLGENALPEMDLDAFTGISAEEILSTIVVAEGEGVTAVTLSIGDAEITAVFSTQTEDLLLDCVTLTIGEMQLSATQAAEALCFEFNPLAEYIPLKEVVDAYADSLAELLATDSLSITLDGSAVIGGDTYTIRDSYVKIDKLSTTPRASAGLTLDIQTQADDGSVKTTTHVIKLVYLDPALVAEGATNVYFSYDNTADSDVMEGTFTTEKAANTWEVLKQIYAQMPDIQALLQPMVTPDENGMPTLSEIRVDVATLFNAITYVDNQIYIDMKGGALGNGMPESIVAQIFKTEKGLGVSVPTLAFDGGSLALNVSLGLPEENEITDETFAYTVGSSASDFSSIDTLLQTLANTSTFRSFAIQGKVDMSVLGLIDIEDKIHLDAKLDIVDDQVYAAVTIDRDYVDILWGAVQAWDDYEGYATLYYSPAEEMIYIKDVSTTRSRKNILSSWVYTTTTTYTKYTVEEFMADPMTPLFDILHFSDLINDTITDSMSKEDSTAQTLVTVENTFKGYSYNGTDTFRILLDLEPMLKDVQDVEVEIKHDKDYNISSLYANVGLVSVIDLTLNASMQTPYNQYQGVREEIETQKASGNYA